MRQNNTPYNPKNERVKREYLRHMKEAKGRAKATVDAARKAIHSYEVYTGFKDFGTFNKEQAIGFKRHLVARKARRGGQAISLSTALHTINTLKDFFAWLASMPGYKSRIKRAVIDYLSLSGKEVNAAQTPRPRPWPTLEQIRRAIEAMPTASEIDRRNQALLAFAIVSGMRDGAIATLRLKHIDVDRNLIRQDPLEVATKFSKYIETTFFPVGDDLKQIVLNWLAYLRMERLFGPDDPIFPKTLVIVDAAEGFRPDGLSREFWADAAPIRQIFQDAFSHVGLPYFNPHSFRKTLTDLGQRICKTPEDFKAWSQNLGHEDVMTSFRSYGHISPQRQAEVMNGLTIKPQTETTLETILKEIRKLDKPL